MRRVNVSISDLEGRKKLSKVCTWERESDIGKE